MKSKLAFLFILIGSAIARASIAQDIISPESYTFREVDGHSLHAYVFFPEHRDKHKQTSAILLVHGGGWSSGAAEWTFDAARRFAALGMVAIAIEYRLSQGKITPIDSLADVCFAFQWVRGHARDLRIDPNRIGGYGVSAGGHLVASVATVGCGSDEVANKDSLPNALLLWSPALDISNDLWFHKLLQGRATAEAYSPVEHVHSSTPPTIIVHGAKDTLTPLSGARKYCERLLEKGGVCKMNVYEGVGHLLTRRLEDQESDYDPDPQARSDGIEHHKRFLLDQGFIEEE